MGFTSNPDKITLYMHKHLVQIDNTKCVQNVDMYTLQTEAACVWFHRYCVHAVRGLVSGGWPCTFAPGPRIELAVKDR